MPLRSETHVPAVQRTRPIATTHYLRFPLKAAYCAPVWACPANVGSRRPQGVPVRAWKRPKAACGAPPPAQPRRSLFALGAAFMLAGCQGGASITVDVTVPSPLVEPIDAAMGVYFDEALVNYVHEEELADGGSYRIDIGASQAPVFARVFDAMFDDIVPVVRADAVGVSAQATIGPIPFEDPNGSRSPVDGIIAPTIEEVQFAIPKQTGGDFYEVWIRYKLKLYDRTGNPLGEWPLIGYGKANERNFGAMGGQSPALNEATTWALRDAAAVLSFQFRNQAEVQDWLAALEAERTD